MSAHHPTGTNGSTLGRSVSLDHAAHLLAVSRRTIYNWIRSGRLQTIRTVGGSQRVLVESLRERAAVAANGYRQSAGNNGDLFING